MDPSVHGPLHLCRRGLCYDMDLLQRVLVVHGSGQIRRHRNAAFRAGSHQPGSLFIRPQQLPPLTAGWLTF